jgi:hypothetical protein
MKMILAVALCICFLAAPVAAADNSVDAEIADLQQQLATIQARITYLTALKAAGVQTVPVSTAAPITLTTGACAPAAAVGACGSAGAAGAATGAAPRRQGFFRRVFGGRRGGASAGGCS